MADEPAKKPAKKGKKLKTPQKAGLALGGAVLVYVLYRWYQNRAATTASTTAAGATDPLTGQPYAAGVGSLAAGTDQGAALADPTIDPSTGQTWASEIAAATTSGGIDPATGQTYASEIAAAEATAASAQADLRDPLTGQLFSTEFSTATGDVGTLSSAYAAYEANPSATTLAAYNAALQALGITPSNSSVSPGNTVPPAGGVTTETRAALIADVQKATGLSAAAAGQQVALYLEGKPLTNAGAVNAVGNQVKAGLAPTTSGSGTLPSPVLAKGVTQSPKTSSALTNAEAVAKKDQGTAAEAQAQANVTRTKAIVAKQK